MNTIIIKLGKVNIYLGLSHEWVATKVESANIFAIKDWKIVYGVSIYFNVDISDNVILRLYVILKIEVPVIHLIVLTLNW